MRSVDHERPGRRRSWFGSIWLRTTLAAIAALLLALGIVVLVVYELTLLRSRSSLDGVLAREGDRVRLALVEELGTQGEEVLPGEVTAIASRVLALAPGSAEHLTVVRGPGVLVATASGPERLVELRAGGRLPAAEPGTLRSLRGVRSRGAEIVLDGGTVLVVETHGDDREVTSAARSVAMRVTGAAAIGGVAGIVVLALGLRRSTIPLSHLSATVRRTRFDDLSRRVPEPRGDDEVAELVRDVNHMLDQLVVARAARDELVATASHELRTPLAAARGHLELVLDGRTDDRDVALTRVDRELAHLTRLVDDVLALARAGDPARLALDLVDVGELLDELDERHRALGVEHLSVEAPSGMLITADRDRVLQLLSNLVDNAVVHTPEGTEVRVAADVVDGGRWVELRVADDGPGIPEIVRAQAPAAFVRHDSDGTGLGLAIVHAIAVAHGGACDIETGPSGTTVTARLPVDAVPDDH